MVRIFLPTIAYSAEMLWLEWLDWNRIDYSKNAGMKRLVKAKGYTLMLRPMNVSYTVYPSKHDYL